MLAILKNQNTLRISALGLVYVTHTYQLLVVHLE